LRGKIGSKFGHIEGDYWDFETGTDFLVDPLQVSDYQGNSLLVVKNDGTLDVKGKIAVNDNFIYLRQYYDSGYGIGYYAGTSDNLTEFRGVGGFRWMYSPGGGSELMRLNYNGLGIGCTSPTQALQVGRADTGNGSFDGQIVLGKTDGTQNRRLFKIGLDSNYHLSIGDYGYTGAESYSPYVTIKYNDGGKVGIGTTSPGEKLEVNGDIKFGSQGVKISTGTDAPQGSVPGNPGDLYVRTNSTYSTLYINISSTSPGYNWNPV
jgi:hypothetical protein